MAFIIAFVTCEESSEEDVKPQRIYNNGQPLTLPQLLQIQNLNSGFNPTTASPLFAQSQQPGLYNPTTASPLFAHSQQAGIYNPTTASPLVTGYNPTTATPQFIYTQQGNAYNPTTASPIFIQQGQSQGKQPVQVIQIPNQQKPNNIYVQAPQSTVQPQIVVIPSKKPKPSRPNKRPTTTVQPPIYVQTQQPSQTPVQVIQVTGKPATSRPPIVIQTQPQQNVHQPIQVVTIPNQQIQPQQEIYQIYPGQLDNPTDYEFNWYVNNQESGDYKSHREIRQNDVVQGQYEVLDPDGFRRIVSYTADEVHGFRAVVRRIPLNEAYAPSTQRPFYNNNNNNYFIGSTTQRPFGSRGRKHASVAPVESASKESESNESQ